MRQLCDLAKDLLNVSIGTLLEDPRQPALRHRRRSVSIFLDRTADDQTDQTVLWLLR